MSVNYNFKPVDLTKILSQGNQRQAELQNIQLQMAMSQNQRTSNQDFQREQLQTQLNAQKDKLQTQLNARKAELDAQLEADKLEKQKLALQEKQLLSQFQKATSGFNDLNQEQKRNKLNELSTNPVFAGNSSINTAIDNLRSTSVNKPQLTGQLGGEFFDTQGNQRSVQEVAKRQAFSKQYPEIEVKALAATKEIELLDGMEISLNDGVAPGKFSNIKLEMAKSLDSVFGTGVGSKFLNTEIGSTEFFNSLSSKLTLLNSSAAKGSVSDFEFKELQKQVANLGNTEAGARMIINFSRELAYLDQEQKHYMDTYGENWSTEYINDTQRVGSRIKQINGEMRFFRKELSQALQDGNAEGMMNALQNDPEFIRERDDTLTVLQKRGASQQEIMQALLVDAFTVAWGRQGTQR